MGFSREEYWSSCHFLLQGFFLTQGSNLYLLHRHMDSLPLSHQESLWRGMEALQSSIRSPQLGKYFLDTYYVLNSAREMKITKKGSSLAFVVQLLSCVKLLDCSTSGFPVFHYFPEFAQTHVHGYLTISSSVALFSSCPQSLPASGSFPMSQLCASSGQSTGVYETWNGGRRRLGEWMTNTQIHNIVIHMMLCGALALPRSLLEMKHFRNFRGGPVVKNLPFKAGDTGLIPDWTTR